MNDLNFKNFVQGYLAGLKIALTSDIETFSLGIFAVAYAIMRRKVSAGVAAFFLPFALIRIVTGAANAITNQLQFIGVVIRDKDFNGNYTTRFSHRS